MRGMWVGCCVVGVCGVLWGERDGGGGIRGMEERIVGGFGEVRW